jgi:hypothetical protein
MIERLAIVRRKQDIGAVVQTRAGASHQVGVRTPEVRAEMPLQRSGDSHRDCVTVPAWIGASLEHARLRVMDDSLAAANDRRPVIANVAEVPLSPR